MTPYLARAVKNVGRRALLGIGIDPLTLRYMLKLRKGAIIDQFRRTRGLPPMPRREM